MAKTKKKPRDIAELVNAIQWSLAILNKTLPASPVPRSSSISDGYYARAADATALRAVAFRILVTEQLREKYEATPGALSDLIPHLPEVDTGA